MKMLALLITFFTLGHNVLACEGTAPRELNMAISIENNSRFFYNGLKVFKDKPEVNVHNCKSTAANNAYMMIGIGLQNLVLSNLFQTYSYNDGLSAEGDRCQIENNPFEPQTAAERTAKLHERRAVLNHCLNIQVTDFSSGGMIVPENQTGCQVTRISSKSVDFKGPFCFFKPYADSTYSVHVEVDPKCYDPEYMKVNNISLQDINSVINTYTAGDASGTAADLQALSSTDVRFSINPTKELMNISDDFGVDRPSWPTSWQGGSVDLGSLKMSGVLPQYDHIALSFVVDTQCPRKCVDGICSSKCDYAQPVIGRFSLFEKTPRRYEFLKTWFDGAVAPAQWQGILHGVGMEIKKGILESGKKYRIEVEFDEPDISFAQFDGRIKKMIYLRNNHIHSLRRNGGLINTIPLINIIEDLELIPTLEPISIVDYDNLDIQQLLGKALASFHNYLNNSFWPPYYEEICNKEGECQSLGKGKIKFTLDFDLGEKNKKGQFAILNPVVKKEGNLGRNYDYKVFNPAKINCGVEEDDDDIDTDTDFDF
jgi:hypothetical protein